MFAVALQQTKSIFLYQAEYPFELVSSLSLSPFIVSGITSAISELSGCREHGDEKLVNFSSWTQHVNRIQVIIH